MFIIAIFLVVFKLQPLVLAATQFNPIDVNLEDTKYFPGNWSLTPEEIYIALKHSTYENKFKILEFGAGESTLQLAKLLTRKNIPFEYHVFENDSAFIKDVEGVTYHYYYLPPLPFRRCNEWKEHIQKVELQQLPIFDLVIVDGPHGVARAHWYSQFKKYTRDGTVILIDDFHHYQEFSDALDANFNYLTIIEYQQTPRFKIINEGVEKLKNNLTNKSFKIVKVMDEGISR